MKHLITYMIACLWCWATLIPLKAQSLRALLLGRVQTNIAFVPYTAGFDGSNDNIRFLSSAPTGLADGTSFTISILVDLTADGADEPIFCILNNLDVMQIGLVRLASGKLNIHTKNTAGTDIGTAYGDTSVVSSSGWQHVFVCWKTSTASDKSLCKIYVNGVLQSLTWTTDHLGPANNQPGTIDFVGNSYRYDIGANRSVSPILYYNGSLAEFWFDDTYNDIPSSFFAAGSPVDLGSNGATPTGSQPVFYLSRTGSGNSWITNSGTFGLAATLNGGGLTSPSYP